MSLGDKWFKPFFQGSMKCEQTKEEWSYDRGTVKCVFGAHGALGTFTWDGSVCRGRGLERDAARRQPARRRPSAA